MTSRDMCVNGVDVFVCIQVLEVDYPKVMVSSAIYRSSDIVAAGGSGQLLFSLVAGDKCSAKGTPLIILLRADIDKITHITLNESLLKSFEKGAEEGTVVVTTEAMWESCVDGTKMEFVVSFV